MVKYNVTIQYSNKLKHSSNGDMEDEAPLSGQNIETMSMGNNTVQLGSSSTVDQLPFDDLQTPSKSFNDSLASTVPSISNSLFFKETAHSNSLIKWTTLNQIYSLVSAYGGPTCILPTKSYFVLGTSKGALLIFNFKEFLQTILLPQISDKETLLRSAVKTIAVATDGTYLAAAYQSGDVFIWNLNLKTTNEDIPFFENRNEPLSSVNSLDAILHITYHKDSDINGMGFLHNRHTALIVSDSSSRITFHNGFRNSFWNLTYSSKDILSLSPNEKLFCSMMALPPRDSNFKSGNLLAILTNINFVILSTSPHPEILFQENLHDAKSNTTEGPIYNSSIAWSTDRSQIAYCINKTVFLFGLSNQVTPLEFVITRRTSTFTESILSLQWLNPRLLGILTISHQFLIVDTKTQFEIILKIDLLVHDLLIPPDKHFAFNNNRIFLLTLYGFKIGSFVTWSDITLSNVQKGDYMKALSYIELFLRPNFAIPTLLRLEPDQKEKETQLLEPFYNLALATQRFLLKKRDANYDNIFKLVSLVVRVLDSFHLKDTTSTLKISLNSFLEQALEFFDSNTIGLYYEVLSNLIIEGYIRSVSAPIFKNLISYFSSIKRFSTIQELIIILDSKTLDIDLAVKLCKEFHLSTILIYLWNKVFLDYISPLVDYLHLLAGDSNQCMLFDYTTKKIEYENIFTYLSFILLGKQYPENIPIMPQELQDKIKMDIYGVLLNGTLIEWPKGSGEKVHTVKNSQDEPAFPYLHLLLNYDIKSLLSLFNKVFEDSLFNISSEFEQDSNGRIIRLDRQYIIDLLLDILKDLSDDRKKSQLAVFVALNVAKFPQFISLSNNLLEEVISNILLCHDNSSSEMSQIAIEAVIPIYAPKDPELFILEMKERNFNGVLFSFYRHSKRYFEWATLSLDSESTIETYGTPLIDVLKLIIAKTNPNSLEHSKLVELFTTKMELILSTLGTTASVKLAFPST